jgi:hypothetical protein
MVRLSSASATGAISPLPGAGALEPLVLDLVEWVAREPRTHAEVMDAWRTSCPRLTVWEEALERDLLSREAGRHGRVRVTATGYALLTQNGRHAGAAARC